MMHTQHGRLGRRVPPRLLLRNRGPTRFLWRGTEICPRGCHVPLTSDGGIRQACLAVCEVRGDGQRRWRVCPASPVHSGSIICADSANEESDLG